MPAEGPCRDSDAQSCRVRFNFYRIRQTGPSFPLAVLRCTTHGCSFTVYPPGYVPYGRQPILNTSPSGNTPLSEGKTLSQKNKDLFAGTLFQAGLDAAAGLAWQREGDGLTVCWWPNQIRILAKLLRLLGVDPALSAHERERFAAVLDVEHLFLNDCVRLIECNAGYKSRGVAIKSVLDRLVNGPCVLDRLLVSGYLAGLWGCPLRWYPDIGLVRSLPFPEAGSRSPPL